MEREKEREGESERVRERERERLREGTERGRGGGGEIWLFTKSRPARIHHPSRGIHVARAQLKFRSKGPVCPTLRVKPFPKVADLCCRFPLPTLFYGPEAAHTGDMMRLWVRTGARVRLAVNLSRTKEACRTPCKRSSALPTNQPYLQAVRYQGKRRLRGWTPTAFSSQGMSCNGASGCPVSRGDSWLLR